MSDPTTPAPAPSVKDISFFELEILVAVAQQRSLRATARSRHLQPSHVSKVLARLEEKLQTNIFVRSASGVVLTREGQGLREIAEKILAQAELLTSPMRIQQQAARLLTIGAVGFLNKLIVAPCLPELTELRGEQAAVYRFRLLDMGPDELVPTGMRGALDLALHVGPLAWTKAWTTRRVGNMTWGLFCAQAHPLGRRPSVAALTAFPFVVPTYWQANEFLIGNDHCPLSWTERAKGHETSSAEAAVAVVKATEQLAFIPTIVAQPAIVAGDIRQVEIEGWRPFTAPLLLSVRSQAVPARLQQALLRLFPARLI